MYPFLFTFGYARICSFEDFLTLDLLTFHVFYYFIISFDRIMSTSAKGNLTQNVLYKDATSCQFFLLKL